MLSLYSVGRAALPPPNRLDDCSAKTEEPAENHHVIARSEATWQSPGRASGGSLWKQGAIVPGNRRIEKSLCCATASPKNPTQTWDLSGFYIAFSICLRYNVCIDKHEFCE